MLENRRGGETCDLVSYLTLFAYGFSHTARKGEGELEGREKLFGRCSHRKCHLKDNKVASTVSLACVSFALFKVKLKFKLLYKCL